MSIIIRLSCGYSFAGLGALSLLLAFVPLPEKEIKSELIISIKSI
jgi:hypothetical protein